MLKKKLCCFKAISIFVFAMIIISDKVLAPTTPTKEEIERLISQVNEQLAVLEAKFAEILSSQTRLSGSARPRPSSPPPPPPPVPRT
jgi:uncharacterized protein YoxC